MFNIEHICVGLIVLLCLIFIIRKLKNPGDFSCPGCSGCNNPDKCDKFKALQPEDDANEE